MKKTEKVCITVQVEVNATRETVWKCWTSPESIVKWNNASEDWHTTRAENDLRVGGKFSSRMEAKDGSMGFDFEGIYEKIIPKEEIEYLLGDGRKVKISFSNYLTKTKIVETFDAESENTIELQKNGWQSILNNFKKYAEENKL